MAETETLEDLILRKTHRLVLPDGPAGDGAVAARQFDAVLMSAGFKLSGELLERLSRLAAGEVIDLAVRALAVVRREIGDHVRHNVYFMDFPANVPDTLEFWARCLTEALLDPAELTRADPGAPRLQDGLNLLALPSYGRYLHTYEEMVAAHADLIPGAGDRVTVLHLAGTLEAEAHGLYLRLAAGPVPLNEDDLSALGLLAGACAEMPQPQEIPVRENRAVINRVRLETGHRLLLDTITDVLRLACALSGGDVSLLEPTRFVSLPRPVRRELLTALDGLVERSPAKLGDVAAHRERWKRLGERLHPYESSRWPHARKVFDTARGEHAAPSLASRVETALAAGELSRAVAMLSAAPGALVRSLDRLLRAFPAEEDREIVLAALARTVDRVSGRVLLQLREHLQNRAAPSDASRVFANRRGRAWVAPDTRDRLGGTTVDRLLALLDAEVRRRLPRPGHLLLDPEVLDVALPLAGKSTASGFKVLPRGSLSPVDGRWLRFFIYWRQSRDRTDFDLSALLLDEHYAEASWLSWTDLTGLGGEHSGDITEAPEGASEFINLDLEKVTERFIIPQVDIYSGEGFEEVAESFFGFMLRDPDQRGRPYEPATVRMKSDLRGAGRVALPLVFLRTAEGVWKAKWMHLYLHGEANFNQVEGNRLTTALLVRGIVERGFLNVRYLTGLLGDLADSVTLHEAGAPLPDHPVTYIGLERPEGLTDDSTVITLENLSNLIPQ